MAFEKRDYQKSEGLLLRAQRPELAVKFYKVSDAEREGGGEGGGEGREGGRKREKEKETQRERGGKREGAAPLFHHCTCIIRMLTCGLMQ